MADKKPAQNPAPSQPQQPQPAQQPSQFPRPAMQEIGKSADHLPMERKGG